LPNVQTTLKLFLQRVR